MVVTRNANRSPPLKTQGAAQSRNIAPSFEAIVRLIDAARHCAHQAVKTALMDMSKQSGQVISPEYQAQLPDRALLLARLHKFRLEGPENAGSS